MSQDLVRVQIQRNILHHRSFFQSGQRREYPQSRVFHNPIEHTSRICFYQIREGRPHNYLVRDGFLESTLLDMPSSDHPGTNSHPFFLELNQSRLWLFCRLIYRWDHRIIP
eukprot:Lithocolla_globosa_v1_NODE_16_length_10446_cov_10.815802.p12 type:complete len:111 gc:universal NODE_16_length_10446_cov_10.815802:4559-4227(-)